MDTVIIATNFVEWRTDPLHLRMGPQLYSNSEKVLSLEAPVHFNNNVMETITFTFLGNKGHTLSLHSWYILCPQPFFRKELYNCYSLSNSVVPDLVLPCNVSSHPPHPLCSSLTKQPVPKSFLFLKQVLLGKRFQVQLFSCGVFYAGPT